MSRLSYKYIDRNSVFICEKCGKTVISTDCGTSHRNHCPECLWSKHVDFCVGDRLSVCKGMMEPIGLWEREDGELALIHRCIKCGFIRHNRIASDDNCREMVNIASRTYNCVRSLEFLQEDENKGGKFI